ncbi:hypothetical protein BDV95DRAFT_592260 [Massariosphaeria phaeospora]|uniref:Uncharacterized protein n=1 Tax=Massariosphaeria phaeospora TaxID=100035 RepID=A0A7C8I9M2_9PLEO|nr:hypothetical protein BDV95DRAFT_592260 [Massariosphaeria phaeospora]
MATLYSPYDEPSVPAQSSEVPEDELKYDGFCKVTIAADNMVGPLNPIIGYTTFPGPAEELKSESKGMLGNSSCSCEKPSQKVSLGDQLESTLATEPFNLAEACKILGNHWLTEEVDALYESPTEKPCFTLNLIVAIFNYDQMHSENRANRTKRQPGDGILLAYKEHCETAKVRATGKQREMCEKIIGHPDIDKLNCWGEWKSLSPAS